MSVERTAYYERIRKLALAKRLEFSVQTNAFGLQHAKRIYRAEGIKLDYRDLSPGLKAIYMCLDGDISVAIKRSLPKEPKFGLVHELKHHWDDRALLENGVRHCGQDNETDLVEKGSEVFAAEFIYPESEFGQDMEAFRGKDPSPMSVDEIVHFKRSRCKAKVSYTFLRKRLEWMGYVGRGELVQVKFQKREEELYGRPIYKQNWFVNRRRAQR